MDAERTSAAGGQPGHRSEYLARLGRALSKKIDGTGLYSCYFGWGPDGNQAAIALGYGFLYNHAATPNAIYRKNAEAKTISFIARRTILSGEEIFITYNAGLGSTGDRLWFDAV